MPSENVKRLAPLTGVLYVVLIVISFLVAGEPPDPGDGPAEIVEWYSDHEGQVFIGAILATLGAISLLFFAATVRRAMRRAEPEMGVLSIAAVAGGAVAATGIGIDSSVRFTLAEFHDEIRPVGVQTLHAFFETDFLPLVIGLGTLILAVSLGALRTGLIPVWLAWIGIVIFVAFISPAGFFAFLASGLWIIVVSILLWRKEAAGVPAAGMT